jgi:serine O-acetyltransferase
MSAHEPKAQSTTVANALLEQYQRDRRAHRINKRFLPSRREIVEVVQRVLQLLYPGYSGRQDLTAANTAVHLDALLALLREHLARQVDLCLCHQDECERGTAGERERREREAARITDDFIAAIPSIRERLVSDVQAAFDGDPAAGSLDEIILAYPGLLAVSVYRVAHALRGLGVPLMPRIMTEWAHAKTGADLHPGAEIAESFFIDHATGVVIGETAIIGKCVKLYQGVTLGALSHPHDENGQLIRGTKRHPTVEDNVTIYANATVLGGQTVIGAGSIIGGGVFLTQSVPPGARVALEPSKLRMKTNDGNGWTTASEPETEL